MAKVDLDLIQQLRDKTGLGMMDCKKALQESDGDIEKAIEILRKKGAAVAEKRSGRITGAGSVRTLKAAPGYGGLRQDRSRPRHGMRCFA